MFIKQGALLLAVFLSIFSINHQQIESKNLNDFEKIVQTIRTADRTAIITEWQILGRETIQQSLASAMSIFKKKDPSYAWSKSNEGLFGEKKVPESGMQLQLKLLPVSAQQTMVLFEASGKSINETNAAEVYRLVKAMSVTGNQKIFTCIKGFSDGKMNRAYENLQQFFAAKVIEKTEERNFISVACDSPLFNEKLINQMTIQIACRQDEAIGRTTFTIGTPIITSEY